MPSNIKSYVRVCTKEPLPFDTVREWYKIVSGCLSSGLLTTFQAVDEDGALSPVSMVHREEGGKHSYTIPTTRDVTDVEAEPIVAKMADMGVDWEFEVSAVSTKSTPHRAAQVATETFDALAEELAKRRHNRWISNLQAQGWRYGDFHEGDQTHPLVRPWTDLTDDQKEIDYDVPQMVMDMLTEAGYVVIKREEFDAMSAIVRNRK